MTEYYDNIAKQYKKSKTLPFRLHVEWFSYKTLLANASGMSVLDLACGEGFYTRRIKNMGAANVVGVDISEKMIELARKREENKQLGIQYIISDVMTLGKIGDFDLVVASYLLNYAQTRDQLLKMCQTIFVNLKPGGRAAVVMPDNVLFEAGSGGNGRIALKGWTDSFNNVVSGNSIYSTNSAGYAIFVNSGAVISNNNIKVATAGGGIRAFGTSTDRRFVIIGNKVDVVDDGIMVSDSEKSIIANNTVTSSTDAGIAVVAIGRRGSWRRHRTFLQRRRLFRTRQPGAVLAH